MSVRCIEKVNITTIDDPNVPDVSIPLIYFINISTFHMLRFILIFTSLDASLIHRRLDWCWRWYFHTLLLQLLPSLLIYDLELNGKVNFTR